MVSAAACTDTELNLLRMVWTLLSEKDSMLCDLAPLEENLI